MAFGFGAPKAPKIQPGMTATKDPSFWTILDGVLGGDTISEAKFNARARDAALAQSSQQLKLRQGLVDYFAGGAEQTPAGEAVEVEAGAASQPNAAPLPALPSRRRPLPTLAEAGQPLIGAIMGGLPGADKLVDLLAKAQPDIAIGPDGFSYSKNDPANIGRIFGNPTVVGKTIVDLNSPDNIERTVPEVGEGMELLFDGKGRPVVRPIQGYAGAAAAKEAAVTGARKGAEEDFQMVEIKLPDGSTEQMTLGDFRRARGGPAGPTSGAPARPQQGAMGRSQSPADAAYTSRMASASADRFQTIQAEGQRAPGLISKYQQLDTLLGDFEGGKFAPAGLELASALNSLGFKMDAKMSNVQAADSLAKQITLDALGGSLGTAISNGDRDFIDRTQPGLKNSTAGRRTLVQMNIRGLQRKADVARMARAWQQKYGRLDAINPSTQKGFDDNLSVWAERNPLFPQGRK